MALTLSSGTSAGTIVALAADAKSERHFAAQAEVAGRSATAAIRLIKLSRGLPAVLAANLTNIDSDLIHSIVAVEASAVDRFAAEATSALAVASEASIPLASGTTARFVVFRDALGVDQVAIIIGNPDFSEPVPGSDSFGMPDRRRVWLSAMRLWRPASACARAPGKPRRRRRSVPRPGRSRHRPCEQDASLSIAGRRARYARRQHDAGLRGR